MPAGREGQQNSKYRAFAWRTFYIDLAVMRLDHLTGNRQSKAGSGPDPSTR